MAVGEIITSIVVGTITAAAGRKLYELALANADDIAESLPVADTPVLQQPILTERKRGVVLIEDVPTQDSGSGKLPASSWSLSVDGFAFIRGHEELRLISYDDFQPDKVLQPGDVVRGTLTNGYGHTGSDVFIGQRISKEQAESWLREDVNWAESAVRNYVKVPISQRQFDALVSFVYNTGTTQFRQSTLLRKLNEGQYTAAEQEFSRWVYSKGQKLAGLVNRRADEAAMFGVA